MILFAGLKKGANYTAYITAYNSVGATKPSSIMIPVSDDNPQPGENGCCVHYDLIVRGEPSILINVEEENMAD